MSGSSNSRFASARRSDPETIDRQKQLLSEHYGSLRQLYDAVSEIILVLNQDRQIVFFNSVVPPLLHIDNPESLYGMRPGEAMGCIHACNDSGGCGTSESCALCGAVNAVLASLSNKADLQECRLLRKDDGLALDFLVRATPLAIGNQMFSIVALNDISHQNRRRALERIFFHDIMTTAASIQMLTVLLNEQPNSFDAATLRKNLLAGSKQLINELESQRELLAAENNELIVRRQPVDGNLIVRDMVEIFRGRYRDHTIEVETFPDAMELTTDQRLLCRVLGNMIQNAVEASGPAETVSVACAVRDGWAEFRVSNPTHIPDAVQLQLFQRSYSTKGVGRGLGTYSMKLLSERYLDGNVSMSSSPRDGTTFVARFPQMAS